VEAKLDRGENVVVVNVTKDMFVDNFLKEFATAFKKEDGVVGFFFFFFEFRVYCPLLLATRHHSTTTANYYQ